MQAPTPIVAEPAPRPSRPRRRRRFRAGLLVLLLAALAAPFLLPACGRLQIASSFRGPGYDKARGVTIPDPPETVIVALTNATVIPDNRKAFDDYTRRVVRILPEQPGLIGYAVRTRPFGHEVWTMTVWRSEADVEAFLESDTHRAAIREGITGVHTARFHRFRIPPDQVPPSWDDVKARLAEVPVRDYQAERGR